MINLIKKAMVNDKLADAINIIKTAFNTQAFTSKLNKLDSGNFMLIDFPLMGIELQLYLEPNRDDQFALNITSNGDNIYIKLSEQEKSSLMEVIFLAPEVNPLCKAEAL